MDSALWLIALPSLLAATWRMATPLIYASLGETLSERAGVMNIGVEGVMLVGAFTGFAAGVYSGSLWAGVLAALVSGALCGLLFAFFTVTLRANQIVVGTAFNMIGSGLTGFLFRALFAAHPETMVTLRSFPPLDLPGLSGWPVVGEILFRHNVLVYGSVLLMPLMSFVLYRTAFGLAVRAAGEQPEAAEAAGIRVGLIRYVSVMAGAMLAALGGAYLTLAHANQFVEEIVSGRGFIAIAVVVFGRWSPKGALAASLLFGFFYAAQLRWQSQANLLIPYQVLQALPYVMTVLVLVGLRRHSAAPKALGHPHHTSSQRTSASGTASGPTTPSDAFLLMEGIVKNFPGVRANRGITLEVKRGEVHALLGENGAGKTVLMNILYGLYPPDAGRMVYRGQPVHFRSPRDAMRCGIGMVHQHFALVPSLTVAENLLLGQTALWKPLRALSVIRAQMAALSRDYGLAVNPAARVSDLTLGEQQRVEILRALHHGAETLILDEPTAVLTPQEAAQLLSLLRGLAARGMTIIFITHKLDEVMQVSDRVTVLRDGQVMATTATAETTPRELARWMVGRDVLMALPPRAGVVGEVALAVAHLSARNTSGRLAVREVSFEVRAGEVVGVAGVAGNGQTELALALAGLLPRLSGEIKMPGPFAHIPEDRARMGLILPFSLAENFILHDYDRPPFAQAGWLRPAYIERHARALMEKFSIRAPDAQLAAALLSGGNQQRLVVARELERQPRCLLVNQPTRGIDVGATEFVLQQILAQRDAGAAVLFISSELEELLAVSDRILVMYEGRIVGETLPHRERLADIGLMMAGKAMTNDQ